MLEMLSYDFMQRSLWAAALVGAICSMIGVFVVLRGLAFVGAGTAHAAFAGVTLAFFGLFFSRFLPLLDRPIANQRRLRLILHLFAWGQLAACVGLFIAGGHGAPRKVAGDAQGLVDLVPMIGMGLNGLGGLVAVTGGILFVCGRPDSEADEDDESS